MEALGETCGFGEAAILVKGSAYATGGRGGSATSNGATMLFSKSSSIGQTIIGVAVGFLQGVLTLRQFANAPLIVTTKEYCLCSTVHRETSWRVAECLILVRK
jgi:hypothetical protein